MCVVFWKKGAVLFQNRRFATPPTSGHLPLMMPRVVGYTGYANCPYGIDDVTTKIVMSFIASFLLGKTVNEAKADLELSYNNAIYDESLDALQRQLFQTNRDNLIVKGNSSLSINDMIIDYS